VKVGRRTLFFGQAQAPEAVLLTVKTSPIPRHEQVVELFGVKEYCPVQPLQLAVVPVPTII
jgi:hypothetical protein